MCSYTFGFCHKSSFSLFYVHNFYIIICLCVCVYICRCTSKQVESLNYSNAPKIKRYYFSKKEKVSSNWLYERLNTRKCCLYVGMDACLIRAFLYIVFSRYIDRVINTLMYMCGCIYICVDVLLVVLFISPLYFFGLFICILSFTYNRMLTSSPCISSATQACLPSLNLPF